MKLDMNVMLLKASPTPYTQVPGISAINAVDAGIYVEATVVPFAFGTATLAHQATGHLSALCGKAWQIALG
jgi:hypothetical protein